MATPLTTRSDWPTGHPPAPERLRATLTGLAERVRNGEDFRYAVREFLDEFALRADDASRAKAIEERPDLTGDPRYDAYLGALAEHLAAVVAQAPAALRRRGVFIPGRSLHRV